MSESIHTIHSAVMDIASISMYVLELLSIGIIVYTTLAAFWKMLKKDPYARVYLLHGQSIGLTFKLGAEILRTVTAASMNDILEVFLLILIKACMVILIERELHSTEKGLVKQTDETGHSAPASPTESKLSGKYNFSIFNKQTQIDSYSHEIEALKQEVIALKEQLQDLDS